MGREFEVAEHFLDVLVCKELHAAICYQFADILYFLYALKVKLFEVSRTFLCPKKIVYGCYILIFDTRQTCHKNVCDIKMTILTFFKHF